LAAIAANVHAMGEVTVILISFPQQGHFTLALLVDAEGVHILLYASFHITEKPSTTNIPVIKARNIGNQKSIQPPIKEYD